ncbi:hypothetical protein [Cupriavidus sp. IDO]|uniref:hypothetical protein n=1 Tax=Cupriavidus sp. IDO TaxID=1539142 RepID=UPI000A62E33B|nr:hypothetical protein [Cupriavidus sp. IDO]
MTFHGAGWSMIDERFSTPALHEIRNDSLAIGVHLYYKGQSGAAAEAALDLDAHRAV